MLSENEVTFFHVRIESFSVRVRGSSYVGTSGDRALLGIGFAEGIIVFIVYGFRRSRRSKPANSGLLIT